MKRISVTFTVGLAVCLMLLWVASAAARDIRYNYVRGTDFSKYKTYKWVNVPNAQYPNQILDGQIRQAIEAQMTLKGLSKTEENPDLYLAYQIAVNQEKEWNSYSTGGDPWGAGAVGVAGAEWKRRGRLLRPSTSEH